MKKSEDLKKQAAEEENDLKVLGLMTGALREGRLEKFEEDYLPKLKELGYEITHNEKTHHYLINTTNSKVNKGIIDFYPKANKVCIRKGNRWITKGLKWITENLLKS
jgi:hypothetical protein